MISLQELQAIYLESAQAEVPTIDISALSDFDAKSFGCASVGASVTSDCQRYINEAYPQYASSLGINTQLSNAGSAPQYPSSPSVLTMVANNLASGSTYLLPVGTIFTSPDSQTYQVIASSYGENQVTLTALSPNFYVVSTSNGNTTGQSVNAILQVTPPIVDTTGIHNFNSANVTFCQYGTEQETLTNATNRLIELNQTPLCGTRSTDFKQYAINTPAGITDAIILTNNQLMYATQQYTVGVYLVSQDPISDNLLNQGLLPGTTAQVFNRTASQINIDNTQQYLVSLNIMGARPIVNTVATQGIADTITNAPYFLISVTLQNGYGLDSKITLDNNIFTISQLIQREVRRAICQQNYGATLSQNVFTGAYLNSQIVIGAIQTQLDNTLGTSTTTGTLGAYLVNRVIQIYTGTSYAHLSNIPLLLGVPVSASYKLSWIYYISTDPAKIYSNINVVSL